VDHVRHARGDDVGGVEVRLDPERAEPGVEGDESDDLGRGELDDEALDDQPPDEDAGDDALIAPSVTARLLSTFSELGASSRAPAAQPMAPLTEREEEVLVTVALGRTNAGGTVTFPSS
jgi:hypothetical protein